jgi:hypothetical protein
MKEGAARGAAAHHDTRDLGLHISSLLQFILDYTADGAPFSPTA